MNSGGWGGKNRTFIAGFKDLRPTVERHPSKGIYFTVSPPYGGRDYRCWDVRVVPLRDAPVTTTAM